MPDPPVGARVLVPLGKRTVTGVVLGSDSGAPENGVRPRSPDYTLADSAKPLVEILDAEAFLPSEVVALASWVADYYACGVGEAIATAMPPRAWIESERHAAITEAGGARMLSERGARRDLLELLTGGGGPFLGGPGQKAPGGPAGFAGRGAGGPPP